MSQNGVERSWPVSPKRVLFVCTGNSCRSVMAEALFRKLAEEDNIGVYAGSCGTSAFTDIGASRETIEVLKEDGIDVSAHRGRKINRELLDGADLVFVMQKSHRDYILNAYPETKSKLYLLTEFYEGEDKRGLEYGIPDPIGMGGDFYQNVKDVIRQSVVGVIKTIKDRGGNSPA